MGRTRPTISTCSFKTTEASETVGVFRSDVESRRVIGRSDWGIPWKEPIARRKSSHGLVSGGYGSIAEWGSLPDRRRGESLRQIHFPVPGALFYLLDPTGCVMLDRVDKNYREYLSRYPQEGMISVGGSGLPLKESIKQRAGNVYEVNVGQLEQECLVTHAYTLPAISEFPLDLLERLAVSITRLLQAQVTDDHQEYWRFTYAVFDEVNQTDRLIRRDLWQSISYLFHLTLSDRMTFGESHADRVLRNSRRIAPYVAYPALEGLLKAYCRPTVAMDGTVQIGGRITRQSSGGRYSKGDTCSSVLDLLCYLEVIALGIDPRLAENMAGFRIELGELGDISSETSYGLIYRWRNSVTHGEASPDVQYGVVLNLVCLLLWNKIRRRAEYSDRHS